MDPAILDHDPLTLARALVLIVKSSSGSSTQGSSSAEGAEGLDELTRALAGDPSAGTALERRLADVESRAKSSPFYALSAWTPPHVELFPIVARLALALQAGTADVETTATARREAFGVLVRSYESRGSSVELARLEAVAVLEHSVGCVRAVESFEPETFEPEAAR